VGTHLGHIRYQNARGELIGEVRDEVARYGEVREGPRSTPSRALVTQQGALERPLRFHTDRCDVVSLLCVRPARAGGLSKVVSAVSVAEAIRARRPDLHALLFADYWRSRQGEEAGGERRCTRCPFSPSTRGSSRRSTRARSWRPRRSCRTCRG